MIKKIEVERFSLVSQKPFAEVLAAIVGAVAQPKMADVLSWVQDSKSVAEMEVKFASATGLVGLMLFFSLDSGSVIYKGIEQGGRGNVRLQIGNPITMASMATHVPDAAAYAPVTVLVDERADGVHLSYDRMSSFLASYGNAEALKIANDLDRKIEHIIEQAAI